MSERQPLMQGDFVRWKSRRYCVVAIAENRLRCQMIDRDRNSFPFAALLSHVEADGLKDPPSIRTLDQLTPVQKCAQEKAWALLSRFIHEGDYTTLLWARKRGPIIRRMAQRVGANPNRLATVLKLYWKGGSVPIALAPRYSNGQTRKNRSYTQPQGRPPRYHTQRAAIRTPRVMRELEEAHKWLAKDSIRTLAQARDYIEKKYYRPAGADGPVEPGCFSRRQLEYFVSMRTTLSERQQRKEGTPTYKLKSRAITGRAEQHLIGPGDQYEIDSTLADEEIVSTLDRTESIGRVTDYIAIDTWSRFITSAYSTVDPPSWSAVGPCLVNMVTPKVELCRRYGVEIDEALWPSTYLPRRLLADRAELIGLQSDGDVLSVLGLQISNTAAYRGDHKANVERSCGTLTSLWRGYTTGYVRQYTNKRQPQKQRPIPILNINEHFSQLIRSIIQYNNFHILRDIEAPVEFLTQGIPPTPKNLFVWGIENRSGRLRSADPVHVELCALPEGSGTLTERGIRFASEFYLFEHERVDSSVYGDRRIRSSLPIRIKFNPADVRTIWAEHPENKALVPARLSRLDRFSTFGPLHLASLNALTRKRRKTEATFSTDLGVRAARHRLSDAMQEVADKALSASGERKKNRRGRNRELRAAESNLLNGSSAAQPPAPSVIRGDAGSPSRTPEQGRHCAQVSTPPMHLYSLTESDKGFSPDDPAGDPQAVNRRLSSPKIHPNEAAAEPEEPLVPSMLSRRRRHL